MSQITVDDGTTVVNVDQNASLDLSQGYQDAGGSIIHRTLNGTGIKQTHWAGTKRRITVTCAGWVPPGLSAIDYSVQITLTLRDPDDTDPEGPGISYTVFATPPRHTWDINKANFSWTLECEEV